MRVTTTVNGERREVDDVWEGESLLYVLRERMGLPGSKNACEQGECGSCTVYLDGAAGLRLPGRRRPGRGPRDRHRRGARRRRPSCTPSSRRSSRRARCSAASAPPACSCRPTTCWRAEPRPDRPRDPGGAGRQPVPLHRATRRSWTPCAWRGRSALAGSRAGHEHHGHRRRPRRHDGRRPRRARRSGHVVARGQPDHRGRRRSRARGRPSRRRPGRRRLRLPAHARAGQHPPPPLPVGDPRARRRRDAVRLAHHALPGLGPDRRACRQRRRPRRPGLARPHRLHDEHRPPLRVPPRRRRPARPPRSRPPARSACASTRPAARWTWARATAASRPTTWSRTSTRCCSPPRPPSTAGTTRRPAPCCGSRVAPCSPFSVTADLLREAAALARAAGRAAAHPPRRDARRGEVLPRALRLLAGGLHGEPRLARRRRLVRARRAPRRRRGHRRSAPPAPVWRTAPRPTAGSGSGIARARDLRDAGARVGLGVDGAASNESASMLEEVRRRAAVRPGHGRPAGALGPRRPRDGHARRCRGARPRRPTSARWRRASWPTSRSGGSTRFAHADIADPVAALVLGSRPPLELLLVDGRPVVEHDRVVTVDEHALAREAVSRPPVPALLRAVSP